VRSTSSKQAGFSLVELMVVVVIMGLLATGAVMMVKSDPTAEASRMVAASLQGARRLAISGGAIPSAVIDNMAAGEKGARVQVEVSTVNGRNVLSVYMLVETPGDQAEWRLDSQTVLPSGAYIFAVTGTVASSPGGTAPTTGLAESATARTYFFPNGQAGAQTWWLRHRTLESGDHYRVFVLPVSGLVEVQLHW
jgi:prepilin-type N-terminal cleavage/methylation domain-containing protein